MKKIFWGIFSPQKATYTRCKDIKKLVTFFFDIEKFLERSGDICKKNIMETINQVKKLKAKLNLAALSAFAKKAKLNFVSQGIMNAFFELFCTYGFRY